MAATITSRMRTRIRARLVPARSRARRPQDRLSSSPLEVRPRPIEGRPGSSSPAAASGSVQVDERERCRRQTAQSPLIAGEQMQSACAGRSPGLVHTRPRTRQGMRVGTEPAAGHALPLLADRPPLRSAASPRDLGRRADSAGRPRTPPSQGVAGACRGDEVGQRGLGVGGDVGLPGLGKLPDARRPRRVSNRPRDRRVVPESWRRSRGTRCRPTGVELWRTQPPFFRRPTTSMKS